VKQALPVHLFERVVRRGHNACSFFDPPLPFKEREGARLTMSIHPLS
jgi:hypothetical protein